MHFGAQKHLNTRAKGRAATKTKTVTREELNRLLEASRKERGVSGNDLDYGKVAAILGGTITLGNTKYRVKD